MMTMIWLWFQYLRYDKQGNWYCCSGNVNHIELLSVSRKLCWLFWPKDNIIYSFGKNKILERSTQINMIQLEMFIMT